MSSSGVKARQLTKHEQAAVDGLDSDQKDRYLDLIARKFDHVVALKGAVDPEHYQDLIRTMSRQPGFGRTDTRNQRHIGWC